MSKPYHQFYGTLEKPRKRVENKRYLEAIRRDGWCVICGRIPAEDHHPIMDRFGQSKCDDEAAIALCTYHHRELHAGEEAWRAKYGNDYDFIAATQDMMAGELNR